MASFSEKIKEQKRKINIKEFDFPLNTKIEYSLEGNTEEATLIKLTSPTSKNMSHCAILKQAFFRAINDLSGDGVDLDDLDDSSSGDEMDSSSIIQIMYMSKSVEMNKILITARELFSSGIARVDGVVNLTKPLIDLMSQDDMEGMLGEYLANFTLSSVLSKMK